MIQVTVHTPLTVIFSGGSPLHSLLFALPPPVRSLFLFLHLPPLFSIGCIAVGSPEAPLFTIQFIYSLIVCPLH